MNKLFELESGRSVYEFSGSMGSEEYNQFTGKPSEIFESHVRSIHNIKDSEYIFDFCVISASTFLAEVEPGGCYYRFRIIK